MTLDKQIAIDSIEVLENGAIQVRQITRIVEDEKELSSAYHRWVLSPGDDLAEQEAKVVAIANAVWTPEIIAAYKAQQEANKPSVAFPTLPTVN